MWDNLPIDADRRMAVCSVEWTAVVNGGKFKFKPIESCLCLVLNIQFTSQQPLVSGEMKLLPLQHFSISPESWLLSSHRSLSLQIWRLEICYWFCNSIFSSNIWHGFWQKAAMISWLKYIDQLQHRHTDELWIPIKAKFCLVLCGSQCDKSSCWTLFHDWCQVPQLSILSFDVQADWMTRWHHVNTVWLHWAGQCFYHLWYTRTPVSGTLFSRSSEAESPWNLYLYQSWGICSRRPRQQRYILYW